MRPAVHVITLAVADLERSLAFYRDGLGFETDGIIGDEYAGTDEDAAGATAVFTLEGGLLLAVYPRSELAKDASIPLRDPAPGEFSIGHLVHERQDVDVVLALAAAHGATLTAPPRERPWGIYSGYFRDPDGHLWEVIWNPRFVPG